MLRKTRWARFSPRTLRLWVLPLKRCCIYFPWLAVLWHLHWSRSSAWRQWSSLAPSSSVSWLWSRYCQLGTKRTLTIHRTRSLSGMASWSTRLSLKSHRSFQPCSQDLVLRSSGWLKETTCQDVLLNSIKGFILATFGPGICQRKLSETLLEPFWFSIRLEWASS